MSESDPVNASIDLEALLQRATGEFVRRRHSSREPNAAIEASRESQRYIERFWQHLIEAIEADPKHLGMSVVKSSDGQHERVDVDSYFERFTKSRPNGDTQYLRVASVLASVLTMADVLSEVTANFAAALRKQTDTKLPFELDSERFVSLRTLLPLKQTSAVVSGNAPTLVMGGTDTAIKFCWNLLLRAANAFFELEGRDPIRQEIETIWRDSRELIFRIGSGSLASFVALASACTDDASAPLWKDTADLSLTRDGDKYRWMVNEKFEQRFNTVFEKVRDKQQGEYVGCAALYTKVDRLPLAAQGLAEDPTVETTAFSELIRWIDTVARVYYFSRFP